MPRARTASRSASRWAPTASVCRVRSPPSPSRRVTSTACAGRRRWRRTTSTSSPSARRSLGRRASSSPSPSGSRRSSRSPGGACCSTTASRRRARSSPTPTCSGCRRSSSSARLWPTERSRSRTDVRENAARSRSTPSWRISRLDPPLIDAVLFDWGGTLTTFHNVDMIDAWRVAAEVLAPDRVDDVAVALLAAEREVWARTTTTMRSATTTEVLHAASAAVGLPVEEALHAKAVARYLDHWAPTSNARADARPVLHALKERGLRTGLLSNTHWPRSTHEDWLGRDGILDLLDARIYTSDLEHVKPHPDAFGALLDAVDVEPGRAVFVGDRL